MRTKIKTTSVQKLTNKKSIYKTKRTNKVYIKKKFAHLIKEYNFKRILRKRFRRSKIRKLFKVYIKKKFARLRNEKRILKKHFKKYKARKRVRKFYKKKTVLIRRFKNIKFLHQRLKNTPFIENIFFKNVF